MKHWRIEDIKKNFSLFDIQDHALTLAEFERTASYDKFDASTRYVMEMLKKSGFSQIKRLVHKADGKTSAFDCIMPEAWDQYGRSFLQITSPEVPEYERILADTEIHPQSAVIWSAPTQNGGTDGEVVLLESLKPDFSDAKGKWIYLECDSVDIDGVCYRALAKAGAAGLVISDFSAFETSPDDVVWFNGQGFNSWYHEKEAPRLPVFSVSPRRALKLLELLKKDKVILHGEMNTRIYDGEIYTVTAEIPGESEEEYALLAHIYEPFVSDDALGFGLICEFGRQLVQRQVKLKKTLRIVLSMEIYGMAAFLADKKYSKKIFAAMNMDTFMHRQREIVFSHTPICLPRFTDWFFSDWFRKYLPGFVWSESRGNLGDDTFCGDPDIGVPTNWLRNPSGVYHHNTSFYFDVDWQVVKDEFPVYAGAVETLLTDGPSEDYNRRAVRDFKNAAAEIRRDPVLTDFEKTVRCEAEYERYSSMLASWEKFTGKTADLQPLTDAFESCKSKIGPVNHDLFSRIECRARNIVPQKLLPGAPFCLSSVPYEERRQISLPPLLWSLFDGKRDLLTCIRITDGELRKRTSTRIMKKYVEELRFLEQHGYVRLAPAVTVGKKEIKKAFEELGVSAGMELVVHSAFSAIGRVDGGPEMFSRVLMETLGREGTLLMPVFTFDLYEGETFGQPFDVRNSSSTCGILTETFRKMPGVMRSCDPCHSFAAWGKNAADFIRNHHKVPTVSEFSPLGLLEAADGWCMTVSAANAVTFMHIVESSFGAPCLGVRTEEFPSILSDGRTVRLRTWGWRSTTCRECPSEQTDKIFAKLRSKGVLRETMLGNACVYLFRLADYRKVFEAMLRKADCRNRKARPRVCEVTVKSDWDDLRKKLKKTTAFTGDLPEFADISGRSC